MTEKPLVLIAGRGPMNDLLFWQGVARGLRGPHRPTLIILHVAGEGAARTIETAGRPVAEVLSGRSEADRALLDRAVRQENRRIAGLLTDEGLPAVGLVGADRGLIRRDGGATSVPGASFLWGVAARGGIPVVAAVADGPVLVDVADVAAGLAMGLGGAEVLVPALGRMPENGPLDVETSGRITGEAGLVEALVRWGVSVRVSVVSAMSLEHASPGLLIEGMPKSGQNGAI